MSGTKDVTDSIPKPYSGFWRRVLAYLIDTGVFAVISAICGVVIIPATYALADADLRESNVLDAIPIFWMVSAIFFVIYKITLECSRLQATLGKMAVGIMVTDIEGNRLSVARVAWRNWAVWLPCALWSAGGMMAISGPYPGPNTLAAPAFLIALAAFITMVFTRKKQGLHDLTAKTLVVRKEAGAVPAAA